MERKEFSYQLLDGKDYIFSERNVADISLDGLTNKLRKKQTKFIQENIIDKEDRFSLLMLEMQAVYSPAQISAFISDDIDIQKELIYSSFKIKNGSISFDEFQKLVDNRIIKELIKLVNELEKTDEPLPDNQIAKLLKVDVKLLDDWKKNYPQAYESIRNTVKKKMESR